MTQTQKQMLGGLIVIAGILAVLAYLNNKQVFFAKSPKDQVLQNLFTPTSTEETKKTGAETKTTPKQVLTYEQAKKLYEGRRFQFNSTCQATPSSMTVKNGSKIMLDNRVAQQNLITLDGKNYFVKAYEFTVVTLTSKTLPHLVIVNCGPQKNVAQILLQP